MCKLSQKWSIDALCSRSEMKNKNLKSLTDLKWLIYLVLRCFSKCHRFINAFRFIFQIQYIHTLFLYNKLICIKLNMQLLYTSNTLPILQLLLSYKCCEGVIFSAFLLNSVIPLPTSLLKLVPLIIYNWKKKKRVNALAKGSEFAQMGPGMVLGL